MSCHDPCPECGALCCDWTQNPHPPSGAELPTWPELTDYWKQRAIAAEAKLAKPGAALTDAEIVQQEAVDLVKRVQERFPDIPQVHLDFLRLSYPLSANAQDKRREREEIKP